MLDFNINGMQQRAYVGVRRAAAFLGLSERYLEGEFPQSLTLGRGVRRQFLPDPLPADLAPRLRDEWRAWVIGNGLRELDQFLSLYFDEAYDKVQQAMLVSGEHPPHYRWERTDRQTNVADKHKNVLGAARLYEGQHLDDQACLRSLSHARNCLSHDLGIVTQKRAPERALTVRWLALRTVIQQGDKETVIEDAMIPFETDEEEARVFVRVDNVEKSFAVGDHIVLSPDDMLDICLFYNMVIDRVAEAVVAFARECGVEFTEVQAQEGEEFRD